MRRFLFTIGFVLIFFPLGYGAVSTSAVADAAMKRDVQSLRALIGQKADVNAKQADGTTALHWAAHWDNLEAADLLLKAGADPKAATPLGATPMYLACENGNPEMIRKLLAAGVDANATFLSHGETPLMFAARSGSVESVKALLDAGAKIDAQEASTGTTALIWAAQQNHADVVTLLISRGADKEARSKTAAPPARRPGPDPKASTTFETKKDEGPQGGFEKSGFGTLKPKKEEAKKDTPAKDDDAVDDAPPPVIVARGGITALLMAARDGSMETARALLDNGANINQGAADGSTPLIVALQNGQSPMVRMLIDRGANVNQVNSRGWTPLYLAVKNRTIETGTLPVPTGDGMLEIIKTLIDKGADVNARLKGNTEVRNAIPATWLNENGATAFLRASLTGDLEVMKLLLAHGADPKISTLDGTTALMALAGVGYAEGFMHDFGGLSQSLEAMKLLIDCGIDVNAANSAKITALHGAAHKNFGAAIELLVEHGADLKAVSLGNPKTPKGVGLSVLDWAEGVPIGPQSSIYHPDAVATLEKIMKEKNVELVAFVKTKGGNAAQK